MSNQAYFLGVGAGIIAAVVFASATTGPLPVRFILFLLTPLPIFLAGLGWGYLSALTAGLAGSVLIASMWAVPVGIAFALTQALPCVFLCYLALLNRPLPSASNQSGQQAQTASLEWYPIGRIILWTAAISAIIAIAMLLLLGTDIETLKKSMRASLEVFVTQQLPKGNGATTPSGEDLDRMTEIALRIMPAVAAVSIMGGLLFNFWLSARITLMSGRLSRPWPDVAAITYPPLAALILAIAMVASFMNDTFGLMATAVSGAFYLAFVLLGLAILHYMTRGLSWRPMALWGAYVLLVFNIGLSFIPALVGLTEAFSPINRGKSGGPPTLPQPPGPT